MIKILSDNTDKVFKRVNAKVDALKIVSDIILDVKNNGDKALKEYTLKFDKANLNNLRVNESEIEEAINSVDKKFIEILNHSAKNIRAFCEKQLRKGFEFIKEG